MSDKRRAAIPARVAERAVVLARDGQCQLALAGLGAYDVGPCFGRLEMHEVVKASQGGAYTADNGAALCSHHNAQVEANADLAAFARSVGLVRKRGD